MTSMSTSTNNGARRDRNEIFGIQAAAHFLNRKPATLRMWDREGKLPVRLQPQRNERGWRVWKLWQLEEIQTKWMPKHAVPGRGLPHHTPDAETYEARKALERHQRDDVYDPA